MGTMTMDSPNGQGAFGKSMDLDEINRLSDTELYQILIELGANIGPVVASTRDLYEKRLFHILSTEQWSADSHSNSTRDNTPRSSKSTPMRTEVADAGPRATPAMPPPSETVIESPVVSFETSEPDISIISEPPSFVTKELREDSFHTPSYDYSQVRSRPALYSLSPDDQSSTRKRIRMLSNGGSEHKAGADLTKNTKPKSSPSTSTIIEILILSFLIVVGYLFYQEMQFFDEAQKDFEGSKSFDAL